MRVPALLLLCCAVAGAGELEWKRESQDWYQPRELTLLPEPPAGVAPAGEGLLYYAGPCGDRKLLFAIVPGERLIRIDEDFDGDLRDDNPREMLDERPWLKRVVHLDVPEPVAFFFFRRADDPEPRISLAILAHREGTVDPDGRARRVMMIDGDQDLRFDHPDDRILLDLNGDGLIDRNSDLERIVPGKPFRLRASSYVARLEGPGGRDLAIVPSAEDAPSRPRPWRPLAPPRPRNARGGTERLEDLVRQYEGDGKKKGAPVFGGFVRKNILRTIGQLGTPEAFAFLHRVYRREHDDEMVVVAVESMGYREYVDHAKDVAAIARAAKPMEAQVAAINALHFMDAPDRAETYGRLLSGQQDEAVFATAARNLGYLGTAEALKLLDEAAQRAFPASYRVYAYEAATRWRPSPPPPEIVLSGARQADPRLKALALADAVRLDLVETREMALQAAREGSLTPELMLAVTEILGAAGDAEAVRAVLPFADGATASLRGRLLDLLRAIRDPEAIDAVAAGLDAGSPPVRALAADVLRDIPGDRAEAAIVARLRKERQEPALTALIRAAGRRRIDAAAEAIADALRRSREDPALEQTGLWALAQIGFRNPIVARFLGDRVAATDWHQRLAAIDCVVASGDAAAAPLLVSCLEDRVWQVRIAAAHGLGILRAKESVTPLIAALAKEERLRIRKTIGEALFRLTGEDLGDSAELWERWWRDRAGTFEIQEKVPERKEEPRGERRTVAFYGVPVDSDRVIFVLDISSSMGGSGFGEESSELDRAVAETLKVIRALRPEAKANVILFETEIHLWRKGLSSLGGGARKVLETFLKSQKARGSTNMFEALEAALRMKGVETIYLLSDGAPTAGRLTDPDEILEAVLQLNRDTRAAIHCVSLGGDSRLLRRLSEATMGTYVQR